MWIAKTAKNGHGTLGFAHALAALSLAATAAACSSTPVDDAPAAEDHAAASVEPLVKCGPMQTPECDELCTTECQCFPPKCIPKRNCWCVDIPGLPPVEIAAAANTTYLIDAAWTDNT